MTRDDPRTGHRPKVPGRSRAPWSRFRRDPRVWDLLERYLLPAVYGHARRRGGKELRVWCAGCGAGEEAYTLSLVHELLLSREFPRVRATLVATDADAAQLGRARAARYPRGALRDLPPDWVEMVFREQGRWMELRPEYFTRVAFRREDLRERMPSGPLGLVMCRDVVFRSYGESDQRAVLERLRGRMRPRAILVIGRRERLPAGDLGFEPWREKSGIWVRSP